MNHATSGNDIVSDDLGAFIRAAAGEEAAAAGNEFPFTTEVLNRFVAGVRRRRAGRAAAYALVALPILGGAAFGLGHLWKGAPVTPAVSPSPSVSASISPSPSTSPSPSASPSASATPSPSPTPSTTTTTTTTTAAPPPPAGSLPGAVSGVRAQPGGGSGEILVDWDATADATGYRVYRAATAGGSFVRSAKYTVASGATAVYYGGSYEYIHIWASSDSTFQYIEVVDGQPACFRVAAFNDAGAGPKSGVVCSDAR